MSFRVLHTSHRIHSLRGRSRSGTRYSVLGRQNRPVKQASSCRVHSVLNHVVERYTNAGIFDYFVRRVHYTAFVMRDNRASGSSHVSHAAVVRPLRTRPPKKGLVSIAAISDRH